VWFLIVAVSVSGYLLGSFPPGYLAGRIVGVDVRKMGSGNIGATNVLRVFGKPWGVAVFLLDTLKGLAAVRLAFFLAEQMAFTGFSMIYLGILAGLMCIAGHLFPVWLGFKGGKGVATSAGVVFGLMPLAVVIVTLVWVLVFKITRYVSLASVAAALALPAAVAALMHWGMIESAGLLYLSMIVAVLVTWSHRSNFSRLLKGTEQRFTRK
jgi:glycerol-3-phosphate acyltransferase PlsY